MLAAPTEAAAPNRNGVDDAVVTIAPLDVDDFVTDEPNVNDFVVVDETLPKIGAAGSVLLALPKVNRLLDILSCCDCCCVLLLEALKLLPNLRLCDCCCGAMLPNVGVDTAADPIVVGALNDGVEVDETLDVKLPKDGTVATTFEFVDDVIALLLTAPNVGVTDAGAVDLPNTNDIVLGFVSDLVVLVAVDEVNDTPLDSASVFCGTGVLNADVPDEEPKLKPDALSVGLLVTEIGPAGVANNLLESVAAVSDFCDKELLVKLKPPLEGDEVVLVAGLFEPKLNNPDGAVTSDFLAGLPNANPPTRLAFVYE